MEKQTNFYDVTQWPVGDPYEDVGQVINSILDQIRQNQTDTDRNGGGKPGAVIYLPPGDYHLRTQVVIDISYLKIQGSGHGFTSSSIRFNTPREQWSQWRELWPGGSRILVESLPGETEEEQAAFLVKRTGEPRISSVEFENFCIDGLHFLETADMPEDPENTYCNGKTGVYVAVAHDSFRFTGMGMIYLEHAITCCHADALSIHDCFLAECGNCIELRGSGQASKITDNLLGAGFRGYTIFAENFGGLLVTANNVFPRGSSSLHLSNAVRCSITANRFHTFYPGMVILEGSCSENLISSNHFLRDHEPWPPMQAYDNGLDDTFGLFHLSGSGNTVVSNHISESMERQYLKPKGVTPVVIRLVSGSGNYIACNHIVATTEAEDDVEEREGSCFARQVEAILTADRRVAMDIIAVQVDETSWDNIIFDTARADQVRLDDTRNSFRPLPSIRMPSR